MGCYLRARQISTFQAEKSQQDAGHRSCDSPSMSRYSAFGDYESGPPKIRRAPSRLSRNARPIELCLGHAVPPSSPPSNGSRDTVWAVMRRLFPLDASKSAYFSEISDL